MDGSKNLSVRVNVPRILKGESKRFRSAQENVKKSKVVVKKIDNVKVDGLKLSINIYPTFDYTFTLNALSVFTDRPFFISKGRQVLIQ